jgi:site-specific DNA-methyltransferase (adenine-specific)
MTETYILKHGDCLPLMRELQSDSVDLVYLDPPFFTNKVHRLSTRDRSKTFSFDDLWRSHKDYSDFLLERIVESRRLIRDTGSIFLHCDRNASHILRALLDEVFGEENFQSEIIWSYKRWSNSAKGLMPSHQTIFFYTKTDSFKFNPIFVEYSETTNVDQILQQRCRDEHGKAIYARTPDGEVITSAPKKGVPLGDVWDIPFLNPKAKERAGYPTQKPLILLERIISLVTNPGDVVLDPFCGSGTTLVAAQILERQSIGFDVSNEAIHLTSDRLSNPIRTESELLRKGRSAYRNADEEALSLLVGLNLVPVQRNSGIDAILVEQLDGKPVPIRVQRYSESLVDAAHKLHQAAQKKGAKKAFLVRTRIDNDMFAEGAIPNLITVIDAPSLRISESLSDEAATPSDQAANNRFQGTSALTRRRP